MAENGNCILDTLHTQFAENQNHHQSLFVQFLVALLALFAGFGFVYTHTKPDIAYNQTYVEISENLIYFSNIILLSTAVIVSSVLALLNLILLNQGYGFRRDQYLNMIIRKDKLQKKYDDIFKGLYNPNDKGFFDFLPNFYTIFFWFITSFQLFVLISVCSKEGLTCFENKNGSLLLFIILILLIILSLGFYIKNFYKYNSNLKKTEK
ncbi:MAG: hypothetical protein BWX59_02325 [Bacteroidetes bacterium ADurb.Bin028]|jgi:hypothetical protein|nr:MAG: hypothetical protein BWX59_02325 [Bacteroidetes bacterium ADurb.Bin028]